LSLAIVVSQPQSPYPPLALGFFGLGTGYLIFGTQELLNYPARDAKVDLGTGIWGVWMPGFLQFVTGVYLFAGLTLFGTFTGTPPLYMAALAFTAYGVHWFAIGWNRLAETDVRIQVGMAAAFILISALGAIVFFSAHDWPVGVVFVGLGLVYVAEFPTSLAPDLPGVGAIGRRALGFFHLLTGFWLMYMMFAVVLDITLRYTLPT
jgi:hypothetical protein